METSINRLFENNRKWAAKMRDNDPRFFETLQHQQAPKYLWIGCSDSRVPANEIVGLLPGELFVHRNVANLVVHTDFNCLSVLEYAVEVLQVEHIIVCGHYGCGGVRAAMDNTQRGLIDNWLRHIKDIHELRRAELEAMATREEREDFLCELNVAAQVQHVCQTTIVRNAWQRGMPLKVHGWVYSLKDGLAYELVDETDGSMQVEPEYRLPPRASRSPLPTTSA